MPKPGTYYRVVYRAEGFKDPRVDSVSITSGYSTFEDIRKILAVKLWGDAEAVEKIDITAMHKED